MHNKGIRSSSSRRSSTALSSSRRPYTAESQRSHGLRQYVLQHELADTTFRLHEGRRQRFRLHEGRRQRFRLPGSGHVPAQQSLRIRSRSSPFGLRPLGGSGHSLRIRNGKSPFWLRPLLGLRPFAESHREFTSWAQATLGLHENRRQQEPVRDLAPQGGHSGGPRSERLQEARPRHRQTV